MEPSISIVDAEWAEQEARRADSQPGHFGRWVAGRERGCRVCGGVEEGTELGRKEGPHGGFRRRTTRSAPP